MKSVLIYIKPKPKWSSKAYAV